jgi:hypothetical protein
VKLPIYEDPESDELFYADVTCEITNIRLRPMARELLSEEWLPEHDFYFQHRTTRFFLKGELYGSNDNASF